MPWLNGSEAESLAVLRVAVRNEAKTDIDLERLKRGLTSDAARDLADLIYSGETSRAPDPLARMLAAVDVVAWGR